MNNEILGWKSYYQPSTINYQLIYCKLRLFTFHFSLLVIHCSLFIIHYSLLIKLS
jgi:hypothetical protein